MKTAFIGIGKVGFAIASNLFKKGHHVIIATNNPNSESALKAIGIHPEFEVRNVQEAIDLADLIFLSIPFMAVEGTLKSLKFHGKPLVDCTNPIGPGLTHGLKSMQSGAELIQSYAQDSNVVKAFNIYGYENFVDPAFPGYNVKPLMLIAGNDRHAKEKVSSLIEDIGFFPKDTGNLDQSLHIEHMTLLWVKMARMGGHHPNFVWAYLERKSK